MRVYSSPRACARRVGCKERSQRELVTRRSDHLKETLSWPEQDVAPEQKATSMRESQLQRGHRYASKQGQRMRTVWVPPTFVPQCLAFVKTLAFGEAFPRRAHVYHFDVHHRAPQVHTTPSPLPTPRSLCAAFPASTWNALRWAWRCDALIPDCTERNPRPVTAIRNRDSISRERAESLGHLCTTWTHTYCHSDCVRHSPVCGCF